jgi:lipopolysaccharide transport system permease protein
MIVPLSITVTGLIKMGIQLVLFAGVYIWFAFRGTSAGINGYALMFPVLIVMLAGLGLGFGLIISSLTTKYRDLRFLIAFGIQLWMYATPVIYPLSAMEGKYEKFKWVIQANPLTAILETFKYGFLGVGSFSWGSLAYSAVFTIAVLLAGTFIFNRVERSFMDVV